MGLSTAPLTLRTGKPQTYYGQIFSLALELRRMQGSEINRQSACNT